MDGGFMPIVILPVGSLRQRHIDGLFVLARYFPLRKVYILYDTDRKFSEGEFSVKKNAEDVASACSVLNPEILGWDPMNAENIAMTFTEIFGREGIELSNAQTEKEDVLIDISSTPKPVIVVSTFFAILFGLKVYYVHGKASYNVLERSQRMIDELFKPGAETRKKIASILLQTERTLDERVQDLKNLLIHGSAHAIYDLGAQSPAGRHPIEVIPFFQGIGVDFKKKDDQLILVTIWDCGGSVSSIKELYRKLSEKIGLSRLTYRVKKLSNWGLVQATGKREKRLELTPIGKGIAKGLRQKPSATNLRY